MILVERLTFLLIIIINSGYNRRRKWQPTPVFLLGKFHGQRNLVGSSPWGHKESDTTEVTKHWIQYLKMYTIA